MAWYRFDLKWSSSPPRHVTIPKKHVDQICEVGTENPFVYDLLCYVLETRRRAGVAPTGRLRSFQNDVETGVLRRPKGSKGRPNNWGRDFIILNVLEFLTLGDPAEKGPGRRPTANRELKGEKLGEASASEIMALALPHTKVGYVSRRSIDELCEKPRKRKEHDEAFSLYLGSLLDDEEELDRV